MTSSELRREATTIMFADVVESVRLIELDEIESIQRVRAVMRHLTTQVVPPHGGVVMETRGDGIFVRFADPLSALRCAFAVHRTPDEFSPAVQEPALRFRIGLHSADIYTDEIQVYGSGVSVAARIASLAGPGETVVSVNTRDRITAGLDAEIFDIGDCYLKHIQEPVRAFIVSEPVPDSYAARGTSFANNSALANQPAKPRPEDLAKPCIAIIPFQNSNADAAAGSIGDLIAQSVIHAASRAGNVKVIAWLSCKAFANRNLPANEVGAALEADWILTGTCFLNGQRLLVQAELINVKSNATEYSERILDDVSDLLQAESQIAARLASATAEQIASFEAKRVSQHPLPTLESHSLLVGAIGLMHRSGPQAFLKSRDALEHLIERHPRMHAARPWLAKWYVMRTTRGLADNANDSASRAIEQTSRALNAKADDAFALAVQGFVHFHLKQDIDTAIHQLDSALVINPNDALALVFSAAVHNVKGNQDIAWSRANHAMSLSPFDPLRAYMRMITASCALSSEKFELAVRLSRESIRESASHAASWRTLIIAMVAVGEIEAARAACKNLMALQPALTLANYKARILVSGEQAKRAIEALSIAGVPP